MGPIISLVDFIKFHTKYSKLGIVSGFSWYFFICGHLWMMTSKTSSLYFFISLSALTSSIALFHDMSADALNFFLTYIKGTKGFCSTKHRYACAYDQRGKVGWMALDLNQGCVYHFDNTVGHCYECLLRLQMCFAKIFQSVLCFSDKHAWSLD